MFQAVLTNVSGPNGEGQTTTGPLLSFLATPANADVNPSDCSTLRLDVSPGATDMADQAFDGRIPSDPCSGQQTPGEDPPLTRGGGGPMGPSSVGTSAGKGDVNGDGVVDIRDAVLAIRIASGTDSPLADSRARADVSPFDGQDAGDGLITLDDVKAILRIVAGLALQPGVTPTPSNLSAAATGVDAAGNLKVSLYWIGLPNATAYTIYRADAAGEENYSSPIATVQEIPGNHSYTGSPYLWYTDADAAKTDATVYYYTVRAVTASGLTAPSDEVDVLTDSDGIPWDTRDPSLIIAPFVNRIRPTEATGPVRISGPDQTIYDSESGTALPPEGAYDASTNTYTLNNGESFSLPSDRAPADGPQPMLASLAPSKGPYRGVRSDNVSGFTGIWVNLQLPAASEISMRATPPNMDSSDTAYAYIGSGGPGPEVDAGLQYSSLYRNWAAFISVGRPATLPRLGGFAIGQHRVSASGITYFHLRYYTVPPPYANAYMLTVALCNPETGACTSPQSVGVFDDRNRDVVPRMKRVVAIAQKGMGVQHTGSHFGTNIGTAFGDPYLMRGTRSTLWDDSHAPSNLNGTYTGTFEDATIAFLGSVYDEHQIAISIKDPIL